MALAGAISVELARIETRSKIALNRKTPGSDGMKVRQPTPKYLGQRDSC